MAKQKQTDYKRAYNEKTYDRLAITIPKGAKQALETHAQEAGQSVNSYVNDAIAKKMEVPSLKQFSVLITEREHIINPDTWEVHDDSGLRLLDGIRETVMKVDAHSTQEAIDKAQEEYNKNPSEDIVPDSVEYRAKSIK